MNFKLLDVTDLLIYSDYLYDLGNYHASQQCIAKLKPNMEFWATSSYRYWSMSRRYS